MVVSKFKKPLVLRLMITTLVLTIAKMHLSQILTNGHKTRNCNSRSAHCSNSFVRKQIDGFRSFVWVCGSRVLFGPRKLPDLVTSNVRMVRFRRWILTSIQTRNGLAYTTGDLTIGSDKILTNNLKHSKTYLNFISLYYEPS